MENRTWDDNMKMPKVVDYMTGDAFPEGTPSKIRDSKNGAFYYDALRAGWSVRQLQRHARNQFYENIGRDTFHRLSKLIPPDQKIPQPIRDITLRGLDAKIDCLQELENLIELQKYRVSMARAYEEQAKDTDDLPAFMKPVSEEVKLLWTMAKELTNLQINLGLLKSNENIPRFTGISQEQQEVKELVDTWSPESQRKFLAVIEEIDAETNGLSINVYDQITVIDKHCSNKVGANS